MEFCLSKSPVFATVQWCLGGSGKYPVSAASWVIKLEIPAIEFPLIAPDVIATVIRTSGWNTCISHVSFETKTSGFFQFFQPFTQWILPKKIVTVPNLVVLSKMMWLPIADNIYWIYVFHSFDSSWMRCFFQLWTSSVFLFPQIDLASLWFLHHHCGVMSLGYQGF